MEESAVSVDSFFSIIINCDTKNSSIPVENKHFFSKVSATLVPDRVNATLCCI